MLFIEYTIPAVEVQQTKKIECYDVDDNTREYMYIHQIYAKTTYRNLYFFFFNIQHNSGRLVFRSNCQEFLECQECQECQG